jgi:hypothetical protein
MAALRCWAKVHVIDGSAVPGHSLFPVTTPDRNHSTIDSRPRDRAGNPAADTESATPLGAITNTLTRTRSWESQAAEGRPRRSGKRARNSDL